MSGIYWYVSREKLDALQLEFGSGGPFKELSVKLKAPFIEAKTDVNLDKSLFSDAVKIGNAFRQSATAASALSNAGSKPFFWFTGRAYKAVESGVYYVVLKEDPFALILAGSPTNTIGARPQSTSEVSASADPVGRIGKLFEQQRPDMIGEDIRFSCTYVWATLARKVGDNWGALPKVEGLAVYGAAFPAHRGHLDGFETIDQLIIGSPIFVQQL